MCEKWHVCIHANTVKSGLLDVVAPAPVPAPALFC